MKYVISLLVIVSTLTIAQDYPYSKEADRISRFSITATAKIANSISLSRGFDNREINTVPGYAVGLEFNIIQNEDRNAGVGSEFQFENKVYGFDGYFRNIPIYGFYEFPVLKLKYVNLPLIHLQLGYNLLYVSDNFISDSISSSGGLYYGIGFSAQIMKHLGARLLFSSNLGKLDDGSESWFFVNNKINLTAFLTL